MKKDITFGKIMSLSQMLTSSWEDLKGQINLSPKNTYSLIALKRKVLEAGQTFQETIAQIALRHNGEMQPDGSIRVPDEEIDKVNQELAPMQNETTEIEYTPIVVSDDDFLPFGIMEALFDFIELK